MTYFPLQVTGVSFSDSLTVEEKFYTPATELTARVPRRVTGLHFQVRLEKNVRARVSLSTGKNLDEFKGSVYIRPDSDMAQTEQKCVGKMHFVKETPASEYGDWGRVPAFFHIEVGLLPEQFEQLLTSVLHGKVPKTIAVSERSLPFREKASLGDDKTWDIAQPIELTEINFQVPIASNIPVGPSEPWWVEQKQEPSQTEIVLAQILSLAGILENIRRRTTWVIWLLVLLAIITLLTSH